MRQNPLVLASGSPRRRELLERLGLRFEVLPADLDEAERQAEGPADYVLRLAREKAAAVASLRPEALVLAADTAVVLEGQVLGKPADAGEAAGTVLRLSDRWHQVLTAVAVAGSHLEALCVTTEVRFRRVTLAEARWYAATGEPLDKAGAYGVQGIGGFLVDSLRGSPTNVIGLPLPETLELLERAGMALPWRSS